jgi:flagellar basal body rod protein FlgF
MVKVPSSLLERSRMNSIKESSMIEEFRPIEMNFFMIEFFSLKDSLKMVELTNSSLWRSSKIKEFELCMNLE